MRYISTRGQAPALNFEDVLLAGLASDGGLYVPENLPRFTVEAREANQAVVDLARRVADAKGTTPAQVALAWLLAKKPWIVPIPGTRRLVRLEENLVAAELTLTPDDIAELDEASARIQVQGERYPAAMQAMIDR